MKKIANEEREPAPGLRVGPSVPRNPFVALARQRLAGTHAPRKREQDEDRKDLLQRLREAGL